MPERSQPSLRERHLWVRADVVVPGDLVLGKTQALEVTHSQEAGEGRYWMLRFPYGVLYINPAAPVAVVEKPIRVVCPDCEGVPRMQGDGSGWDGASYHTPPCERCGDSGEVDAP